MNQSKKNIAILFFTMIVVMLGFGMIIPILPFYVQKLGASGSALGALMATYGILQFIFAPIWGSMSDRYGRKPILLVGILGNALAQLLFGLSTQLWMLFAARALAGVLSSATLPTAMAYVGDSTSEDERGGGMGVVGSAMGLGMVLGPGLGGWLATLSLSLPFFLASAFSVVAWLLVFMILPEAPRQADAHTTKVQGMQFGELYRAFTGPIGVLFLMSFLLSFGLTNFESAFGLYGKIRYGFSTQQVGVLLTVVGLITALIQGLVTGPMIRSFGEIKIIRACVVGTAIGFVLMTQAANTLLIPKIEIGLPVVLAVGYFVLSNSMLNPTTASLISKKTDASQGVAMGMNNAFLSLGRVVGPLWAGFLFDVNINLPYFSGAIVMVIGFLVSLFGVSHLYHESQKAEQQQATEGA